MKRKNIKISVILVAMLISIVSIIAGTNAYFSSRDDVTNAFVAGDVDIEVDETFPEQGEWNGSTAEKKVRIENKSSVDALIRVAIVPRWVNADGSAWAGDTSRVELNLTTGNIIEMDTNELPTGTDKWVDGNDGYYYYNSLVEEDTYTSYLLDSVSADIDKDLKDRYNGKTLIVDVKAEAVQATKDAYEKTWSNIAGDSSIRTMLNTLCGD